MPRVHWIDVPRTGSHRVFVGSVPLEPGEHPLTSPALKSAQNLCLRTCSKLGLQGRYAVQASRSNGLEVQLIFENADDAHRFATSVGVPHPFDQQHSSFVFDMPICAAMEKIGGPADSRGHGRRAREREERAKESLGWASRPFLGRHRQDPRGG